MDTEATEHEHLFISAQKNTCGRCVFETSLVAQTVKHLPTMQETGVQSLGSILEKEMATHSSSLAWKIPWMEEPGRLVHRVTKSRTRLSDFIFFHFAYEL